MELLSTYDQSIANLSSHDEQDDFAILLLHIIQYPEVTYT
jgi:hypothetical protein